MLQFDNMPLYVFQVDNIARNSLLQIDNIAPNHFATLSGLFSHEPSRGRACGRARGHHFIHFHQLLHFVS